MQRDYHSHLPRKGRNSSTAPCMCPQPLLSSLIFSCSYYKSSVNSRPLESWHKQMVIMFLPHSSVTASYPPSQAHARTRCWSRWEALKQTGPCASRLQGGVSWGDVQ